MSKRKQAIDEAEATAQTEIEAEATGAVGDTAESDAGEEATESHVDVPKILMRAPAGSRAFTLPLEHDGEGSVTKALEIEIGADGTFEVSEALVTLDPTVMPRLLEAGCTAVTD